MLFLSTFLIILLIFLSIIPINLREVLHVVSRFIMSSSDRLQRAHTSGRSTPLSVSLVFVEIPFKMIFHMIFFW